MFMTDRRHRGTVPGDDVRPHAERCGHAAGTRYYEDGRCLPA